MLVYWSDASGSFQSLTDFFGYIPSIE